MNASGSIVGEVKTVVTNVLGIDGRANAMTQSTPLLGSLPEFDSIAVIKLLIALEERFGVTIDDDEVTGEVFETLGTLAAFVDRKLK